MYNGWPSYETWLVNLWLTNDPLLDAAARQVAGSARDVTTTADALQAFVEERSPLAYEPSLYSDLLTAAMRLVDWRCLVEHYRQEAR
jgi:hypothetical protein